VTVTGNGTYTTPAGATPAQAGTYSWTTRYSGDGANAPAGTSCGTGMVTLTSKASPAITEAASGSCEAEYCATPSPTTDTATLSGGDNPTGTIEFKLYDPDATDCSGPVVADETVTVTGNGTYTTPNAIVPDFSGLDATYQWTASYSGDATNIPATTGCALAGFVNYALGT
jgi:hypothetical protein